MTDFVPMADNQSVSELVSTARQLDSVLGQLRESSLRTSLSALEATLWSAETGAGSAAAAIEMGKLAKQMHDATADLVEQVGKQF